MFGAVRMISQSHFVMQVQEFLLRFIGSKCCMEQNKQSYLLTCTVGLSPTDMRDQEVFLVFRSLCSWNMGKYKSLKPETGAFTWLAGSFIGKKQPAAWAHEATWTLNVGRLISRA